jgi:hypothetical protein
MVEEGLPPHAVSENRRDRERAGSQQLRTGKEIKLVHLADKPNCITTVLHPSRGI